MIIASPLAAVLALVGMAVSAALLVDSMRPVPAFCAAEGCAAVRATAWARPLGIPMPVLGLLFFAAALALSAAGPRLAVARRLAALAGGAVAIGLLALQAFVIGEWCRLCVIADLSAIALAGLVVAGGSAAWPRAGGARMTATAALGALAALLPIARLAPDRAEPPVGAAPAPARPGLPEVVAREQHPGEVVVVDFVDFECPYCRALHPRLVEALARIDRPVRVVRKMVPLPQHPGAMPAAIAWCCADAQGKGHEMAEALIAAPVEDLTPEGCERIATEVGLDLDRYRTDVADPATSARVQSDIQDAREAGIRSLPTVYIGSQAFTDASASTDDLEAALQRAGDSA
ncbi:MAG TPA: vitamin K epoxide reductase family protein [Kofleriaceae bacterium]|nr:vitamin K epoxide reductase family protein [Kofleriaceae bacterium]